MVAPEDCVTTVRQRPEMDWVERLDPVAIFNEVEIADDLRLERMHDRRAGRRHISGKDLFASGRATDDIPPIEHKDLEPSSREVRGRNEAVMTGANDDGIVGIALYRPSPVTCTNMQPLGL
jgi:hypothetical protein